MTLWETEVCPTSLWVDPLRVYPDRDSPALRHANLELLSRAGASGPPSLTLSFPSFAPHLLPSPLSIYLFVSLSGCCALPPHSLSAPSSSGSAKGGGAPWPGGGQTYSPSSTCRYRSLAQPATTRLSSVSSHDSGFVSQDAAYSKPPSPMPSDITSQVREHREDHVGGQQDLMLTSGRPPEGKQLEHGD